ncbi:MAG: anti-sigma F factor [Pelotomaculum sp.]|uniref:Anti-sigma F factor n=1 Tax=Pelotomaculum thermopropionicum (strain DSM 13744 / JCM 10971 / SI) TaxID=370438 RepID=A5D2Y4_PELTS|nr:anti-sigma F factor [Pelotomaculum sp.]BAF59406.1 anti-sigma regulatory factor [Pelotomaculum thermopropionicum SI]
MRYINQMKLEFLSIPANVAFARVTVAAFASQLDFTLSDLEEIKVAVSEAVGNSIIHGYENAPDKIVKVYAALTGDTLEVKVEDSGKGIEDVNLALQPAYSTDPERLGLGFVFMQSFMDSLQVESTPGRGTLIKMSKRVGARPARAGAEC